MRIRMHEDHQRREMILEGVISILEGMNPRMLEVKLSGFLDDFQRGKEGASGMRIRIPRSRVSHDRWLVSYADFITLLFGFFVVLYAFAKADQKKQLEVSQAIDSAFRSMGVLSHRRASAGRRERPRRCRSANRAPECRHER